MQRLAFTLAAIGLAGPCVAQGDKHDGAPGEHFLVGYYFGHDDSYDGPADPPWDATLLVDTHPWELGKVFFEMQEISNQFLDGWSLTIPGFETLPPAQQEFDGHGFYSWQDPAYSLGSVSVMLHIDHVDEGLQVLSPFTLQPLPEMSFLGSDFHSHPVYYVDAGVGFKPGQVLTATFHLSDANGALADSEPFTVQFTPFFCDADWNNDGAIDTRDFLSYLQDFADDRYTADLNEDGTVNTQDFVLFLNLWAAGC